MKNNDNPIRGEEFEIIVKKYFGRKYKLEKPFPELS